MPHTADGAPWTHPDTPVGLLLTLGEEAAAWPRQRRQAVKVLLAMRPAAALVAMASADGVFCHTYRAHHALGDAAVDAPAPVAHVACARSDATERGARRGARAR